jgi:hypothetical protein
MEDCKCMRLVPMCSRTHLPHLQYGLLTACGYAQKEEEVVGYVVLGMIMLHTVAELIMNKLCTDDSFSINKLCTIPKLVTNMPCTIIFLCIFL